MKSIYIKHVLLLYLVIFCAFKINSQISFVSGYLITDKNDTLKGEIKINPKKEHDTYYKVFFKDVSGIQKTYKPNKAKGYGFGGNHYVSLSHKDETLFYKRLTDGPILMYKSAYEVINKNESIYEYEYLLFKEGDKQLSDVKENKFKKQMQDWMSDNTSFVEEYEDEKRLNETNAINAINNYNHWKKTNE